MKANDPITVRLKRIFLACVSGPPGRLSFSAEKLFLKWFQEKGTPYYFLFHKNLSRTNIQFAELLSLIKLHTGNLTTGRPERSMHFVLVSDFLNGIQEVVDDLAKSKASKEALCAAFLDLYSVMRHTVLLHVLHGSCTVFFPPHMNLDLLRVCSESGYIHSCGHCIYARGLKDANDTEFTNALLSYLKLNTPNDKKVFFVVYSHEDFTKYDREFAAELRGGLDDVKISAEKYYIANKPLVRFLQELKRKNSRKLFVTDAGDYRGHGQQRDLHPAILKERTVWLMIDRVLGERLGYPGEQQFLICYDQLFKNLNPLHFFDENKPAWVSHTTIPHTLAGAMLNITRPTWPLGRVDIYDPFCGTGTIALESLKFPAVKVVSNDISPIAPLLLNDNLDFFGASETTLDQIRTDLESLAKDGCPELAVKPSSHSSQRTPYDWAIERYDELHELMGKDDEWFDIPPRIAQELSRQHSFEYKLRFYLALRTKLRHVAAFQRKGDQWNNAYQEEVKTLLSQVQRLCDLRKNIKGPAGAQPFLLAHSTYSDGSTIDPKVFLRNRKKHPNITISQNDATSPPRIRFDLIITDPPYGFNNDLDTLSLARLLTKSLDVLIGSLKSKAQLIIALPDRSHSGRRIPVFATRSWITQQVIAKAEQQGFEAIVPANILPRLGHLFEAPYYWNSERALTRSILHFQFRSKKRPQKKRS